MVGNCGFSVAPALPGKAELLAHYLSASAPWLPFSETDFASYMAACPAKPIKVEIVAANDERPDQTWREALQEFADGAAHAFGHAVLWV